MIYVTKVKNYLTMINIFSIVLFDNFHHLPNKENFIQVMMHQPMRHLLQVLINFLLKQHKSSPYHPSTNPKNFLLSNIIFQGLYHIPIQQ